MESVYIDVGRGGYSENVIQVDRGECNVIRSVMKIGHGVMVVVMGWERGGTWSVNIGECY